MPAATAGAMYLRTVLRSTPRLWATSLIERPACQWTRISVISTTWKVLLATLTLLVTDAGTSRIVDQGLAGVVNSVIAALMN